MVEDVDDDVVASSLDERAQDVQAEQLGAGVGGLGASLRSIPVSALVLSLAGVGRLGRVLHVPLLVLHGVGVGVHLALALLGRHPGAQMEEGSAQRL